MCTSTHFACDNEETSKDTTCSQSSRRNAAYLAMATAYGVTIVTLSVYNKRLLPTPDGSHMSPLTCLLFSLYIVVKIVQLVQDQRICVTYCARRLRKSTNNLRISSSGTLTRIRSSVSTLRLMTMMPGSTVGSRMQNTTTQTIVYSPKIATENSFVTSQTLSEIGLSDICDLFLYARDANRLRFCKTEFQARLRAPVRDIIESIETVVESSRGGHVTISTPPIREKSSKADADDMDAFLFAAVVRVFAEWRSVRLVPPGHKRYAIGMNLAKKDLIQNVLKLETACHNWLSYHEKTNHTDSAHGSKIVSPTLRQLLVWEREQNIHPSLPRLTEKSGASGLLWIQRQLHYQTNILENFSKVPEKYPTTKEAVQASYKLVYDRYHGFLVKQMFQSSFDAAPDIHEILYHMNLPHEQLKDDDVVTEAMSDDDNSSWVKDLDVPAQIPLNIEIHRKVDTQSPNIFESFALNFAKKWSKFERFLNQCNRLETSQYSSKNALLHVTSWNRIDHAHTPKELLFTAEKTGTKYDDEISFFASTTGPLLHDLDGLLEKMNMKDPSRC